MKRGFEKALKENPEAHIFCDEMPVGNSGLPTRVLKELSKKIPGANVIQSFIGVICMLVQ
jgi:hypothetical protein